MKTKKRVLIVLAILMALTLSGCGHQEPSEAQVMVKFDPQTVYVYADDSCNVKIELEIKEAKESYFFVETVHVAAEATETLKVGEMGEGFLSAEAEVLNAKVIEITETVYEWWETGIMIWGFLLIISGLFGK